jgi:hypothetical protein
MNKSDSSLIAPARRIPLFRRSLARLCVVLMVWLVAAAGARAATLEGVNIPDTYQLDGKTLVLNGMALRTKTFLHVKVYVVALYLTKKSSDPQQILASPDPKVLVLHFVHSASVSQVQDSYREGESVNCGAGECNEADKADFDRLVSLARAVEVGDTTTYVISGKGLRVLSNNQFVADFPNQRFARMILTGFIGEHPPTPEIRGQLLGILPN